MRACYGRKVRINRDVLHREIVLPDQADLCIHHISVIWVSVLHRVPVVVLYEGLFSCQHYRSYPRDHISPGLLECREQ